MTQQKPPSQPAGRPRAGFTVTFPANGTTLPGSPAPPSPVEEPVELRKIVALHDAGIDGDKAAVLQAHRLLSELRKTKATPLVEAYYGSVVALVGRDAVDPSERFAKALEGLKSLDKVVKSHPDLVQARILRGQVCFRLPEQFFHRSRTAIEDFHYLISRYEQDNRLFSADFYWRILFQLGVAYKNIHLIHEAKAAWAKLLTLAKDPQYRTLVEQEGFVPQFG
ncbi:hypothetical protein GTO89_05440 [Heliobacterium gestii]|uniref:Tetratricopeptide repeat protein n=1 Tax=Heliomicrobium gestii TaxID=2699 RepID=A0A845LG74_HELGE|nr:hypothetical protein [Heliomicrobium gestii]MBM7866191.1 tetratricopeptide (TPR) repeat protein [Heliomicrobium gestii]MZP42483.1 hypothetical protein [Heliomicrobium gestii]